MTNQIAVQQPAHILRKNFVKLGKIFFREKFFCVPTARDGPDPAANIVPEPTSPTVDEIAQDFLESCQTSVKLSTRSTYERTLFKHIIPEFGHIPITELKVDEINRFLREKSCPAEGDPLAFSTIRSIMTVLRKMLQYAGRAGWEVANHKEICCLSGNYNETRILSASEQQRLKEYCCSDTDLLKLGVLICLYTGLRIGELCAMKWGDISLKTSTITVSRTIQRIKNSEYAGETGQAKTKVIFDAPKSKCANRTIPIPKFLLAYMERFRKGSDIFILTGKADVWMEPRTLQNNFKKMLEEAEVTHINFHALRHTFATNCVEQGFDVKVLSKILGHSDVGITLNTYVHPSTSLMRSYMDRLK